MTYLGYNALPFLQRTELLLFPVLLIFCFYLVSLVRSTIHERVLFVTCAIEMK